MNIRYASQFDFSQGIQDATTYLLKQANELVDGRNVKFFKKLGSFERRDGFVQAGNLFNAGAAPQGGIIAKFSNGSKRIVATNDTGPTKTILKVQNAGTGVWTTISGTPTWPVDSILFFKTYLDELYVSGFNPVNGDPIQPVNIDKDLNVSTTHNLLYAPWPYFFEEYLGVLYAANVTANSNRYKDRVYKSSPPLGAMTYMQGAQDNVYATETMINQVPVMTSNSAPSGVAAASTEVNASNQAFGAFDRIYNSPADNTRWIANATTGWLRYDFGAGNSKVIKMYAIGAGNGITLNRLPKDWTFQGSNDASSWTTLDTKATQPTWSDDEYRYYNTSNTTAYRYYRINVTANQGATDYVGIGELGLYAALEANRLIQFKTDSVRYIKPGTVLDVYKAGTETKLFSVTVNTVDKPKNTFTIYPLISTTGTFDSTNDYMVFGSAISATEFATGTPVRVTTTGTMPSGLSALTKYYAILIDTTHVRFALTYEQALIGDYINFTSNGTGTFTFEKMYSVSDNDEIWLAGTKGKLNMFWNTDYPNAESAEFLTLKPGTDSAPTISGIRSSSNRLYIFTKNSGSRFDGSNLVVFNNSVGCISQRSLGNIDDDWLMWVDARGNVRARNDNQSVQENISKAIKPILKKLTQEQLKAVSVGIVDQVAKFYLGTIDGENIRVCYDFDANTWDVESLGYPAILQDSDDYTGELKPYFFGGNGRLYLDETGNMDDDKNIAFRGRTGKSILAFPQRKKFYGVTMFTRNASGLRLTASVDGGDWKTVGRIEGETCFIKFSEQGDNVLPSGVAIDWQISGRVEGAAPAVDGAVVWFAIEEDVPGGQQRG